MTMQRRAIVAAAERSIRKGSRSFALASRLFDRETRERVWLLYAWCRACDDIIDNQDHGHACGHDLSARQATALETVRTLTGRAIAGENTGMPAFDALALLVREVQLPASLIEDVLAGFALDAAGWRPRSEQDLLRYCYHVAGAVGVIMARVMGVPDEEEGTLDRACDLGVAFQLSNIVRDVWDDDAAGRCYLPVEWLVEADIPPGEVTKPHYRHALVPLVARACRLAREYEASGKVGAAALRFRQRWAVLAAANIYGEIGREVEARGAHAWDHRVRVGPARKLGLLIRASLETRSGTNSAPIPAISRRELAALARPATCPAFPA